MLEKSALILAYISNIVSLQLRSNRQRDSVSAVSGDVTTMIGELILS